MDPDADADFISFPACYFLKILLHHFSSSRIKSPKKSQNGRNQDFPYYICLMIEGSGSGSRSRAEAQKHVDPDPDSDPDPQHCCQEASLIKKSLQENDNINHKKVKKELC